MNREISEKIKRLNRGREQDDYTAPVFDLKKRGDIELVDRLIQEKKILNVVDDFDEQVKEFELVKDPRSLRLSSSPKPFRSSTIRDGRWVYFPWRFTLIHILEPNAFQALRSSRNKNLILDNEQKKYAAANIGIAGLNVGNPAAICIALEGGGRMMKFADNDSLSVSNLNRFRASLADLGVNKAILSARQVYEIDPYYQIKVFPAGIVPGKTEEFLTKPKIDVLV